MMILKVPPKFFEAANSKFLKEVDEEEMKSAIWNLHPDKDLCPNGFSIDFYLSFWMIIKKDLLKMIRWVFRKK